MNPSIVICIPTLNGTVSAWTMSSLLALVNPRDYQAKVRKLVEELHLDGNPNFLQKRDELRELVKKPFTFDVADTWLWPSDLVRVRSRAVRKFLHETDASHLLFIDADILFEPFVIGQMIRTGKDCISVPYPRRDYRWTRIYDAAKKNLDPRIGAAEYVYTNLDPNDVTVGRDEVMRVSAVGMGCTLLSRTMLQRMWDFYEPNPELCAIDNHTKDGGKTVYLFQLRMGQMRGEPHLFGEDLSFCSRWKDLGGDCFLYIGDGAPASHAGDHVFEGSPASFAYYAEHPETD